MPTYLKVKRKNIGMAPGTATIPDDAAPTQAVIHTYDTDTYSMMEVSDINAMHDYFSLYPDKKHWIDVKGLGTMDFMQGIALCTNMSKLTLEDVLSIHQRPKVDFEEDKLFFTSRMLDPMHDLRLGNEQISMYCTQKLLVTFQENAEDRLQPVRQRLKDNVGHTRHSTMFLAYSLMDVIIDNYIPVLENIESAIDEVEAKLFKTYNTEIITEIQEIKTDLMTMRKCIIPEKEKISTLLKSKHPLIDELTHNHLNDLYDHCIQISENTDHCRELAINVMDMYWSSLSNRTNEIVKVLTIVSAIFIPLTFIVGVYGMNFDFMPELHNHWGYPFTWAIMGGIALGQIYYFWRRGWFK